jgi:hypothetical protein
MATALYRNNNNLIAPSENAKKAMSFEEKQELEASTDC